MRERTRFEIELGDLGLREARRTAAPRPPFGESETLAYEMPPEPYAIRGGLYSPTEKARAAGDPRGLLRTTSVIGRQEAKLAGNAPYVIAIGKELTRFEQGAMGKWVADYNAFTLYFEEVLRAIGRLRDLLSSGAPEAPNDMNAVQKQALRPTDDRRASLEKKNAYKKWRAAQELYAASKQGRLAGGHVFTAVQSAREIDLARHAFWQVQGKLSRSIEAGKRLDRPKYEAVDISLSDVAGVVSAGSLPGAAVAGGQLLLDKLLEARKNRREYDEKMKRFAEIVKTAKGILWDDFEAFRDAGEVYWTKVERHAESVAARDKARGEARQEAGLFGQALAPPSESRGPVLAAIRMPAQVADAWRSLALIGPAALKKLSLVLAARSLLDKANFHYRKGPDPFGAQDITIILMAAKRADSWKAVLTADEVGEWIAMNGLWDETFNAFNV